MNLKLRKFNWLIGYHSNLSLANKKLIYISIFKPMWTYGCELWGTARISNLSVIERFQCKFLRIITKAQWFVTNFQLSRDLNLDSVEDSIAKKTNRYIDRLHKHPNVEAIILLDTTNHTRRLRRKHPLDF
jgi:hypothetical protein